ncbi:MAG: LamG domain-containing protein [Verrucomicrobia bacterium]|nr:LamG domain-containing protein [Verrucomicrobiota bacterium]
MKVIPIICCCPILALAAAAATTDGLLAYYDFEETAASGGLNNKAPGATGYHATRYGGGTFDGSENPSGPGFSGKADFDSGVGTSDRSQLRAGNALNLAAPRGDAIIVPAGSSALGTSFTIAAWHALTPGPANSASRYHVFESSNTDNWDVSWGTTLTGFNLPQTSYTYLAYVGGSPAGGFGPAGVTTYQWHHVAHVFTASGGITRLDVYLDGAFVASRTVATSNISFTNLHFGRARTGTTGRDWDGMLDEVGLWTRPLSNIEVAELYHRGLAGVGLTADLAAQGKAFVGVVSSNPAQGGATGSGIYLTGQTAIITAVPVPGFLFTGWGAPFESQPSPYSFTVTETVGSVAGFTPDLADPDQDGLTNHDEIVLHGTNPALKDTDGDQLSDSAEVNDTRTDPLVSNLPAVQWIVANLEGTGGLTGPALVRDPGSNTVTLRLGLRQSATLADAWNTWNFTTADASVGAQNGMLRVTVPATADWARFFRFEGDSPIP